MGGRRDVPRANASEAAIARDVMGAQLAILARELGHARSGTIEGVHQLRVAARRMRTALALFAERVPKRVATALERDLRGLGRSVGTVRDLDVLAAAIAKRAKKIDPALGHAATTLVRHVREHRATAHAVLGATLDAPPTRRLLDRLGALAGRTQPSPTGRSDLVRPLVRVFERASRKVEDDDSTAARHRLRIRAKELRYAFEMLDGGGSDDVRALVERLVDLQRRLGDERDAATQRSWLLGEVAAFAGDVEALVTLGAVAEALRRRAERAGSRATRARERIGAKRIKAALGALDAPASRGKAA